jgi:hypothetical protein
LVRTEQAVLQRPPPRTDVRVRGDRERKAWPRRSPGSRGFGTVRVGTTKGRRLTFLNSRSFAADLFRSVRAHLGVGGRRRGVGPHRHWPLFGVQWPVGLGRSRPSIGHPYSTSDLASRPHDRASLLPRSRRFLPAVRRRTPKRLISLEKGLLGSPRSVRGGNRHFTPARLQPMMRTISAS